jgi:hypothetical protein
MARGKPAWSMVRLRVAWGELPPFGAILQMRTGRRYQIIGGCGRSLQALVLPPDAPVEAGTPVIEWQWAKRPRRG